MGLHNYYITIITLQCVFEVLVNSYASLNRQTDLVIKYTTEQRRTCVVHRVQYWVSEAMISLSVWLLVCSSVTLPDTQRSCRCHRDQPVDWTTHTPPRGSTPLTVTSSTAAVTCRC